MGSFKLSGVTRLIRELEAMGDAAKKNAIARALESGASPLLEELRALAPSRSGALQNALKAGRVASVRGRYTIKVGVTKDQGAARYAHLVEYGHGGPHPAPPHPFMRPAFELASNEAYERVKSSLRDEINKGQGG